MTSYDNVTSLMSARSAPQHPSVQGTLALNLESDLTPPQTVELPSASGADVVAVPPPVRRDLQRWALTFAQACVEVVGGDRPVSQLVRWTTPHIHDELAYRAGVIARAGVHRSGRGRGRQLAVRPQVQNVRTCFITDDIVELCARVRYGPRSRFLAGRLEVLTGRWQCTALEFG
ncbi:MAG: Rv3235 family protein [Nocardioides sp.]|nr:Rv3235 family protein [Nocardioides sp.]